MKHSRADYFTQQNEKRKETHLDWGPSGEFRQKHGLSHFQWEPWCNFSIFPVQNHCSLTELNHSTSHNASCSANNAGPLLPHSLARLWRPAWTLKSTCCGSACSCETMVCYAVHTILQSAWPVHCRPLKMCNWVTRKHKSSPCFLPKVSGGMWSD